MEILVGLNYGKQPQRPVTMSLTPQVPIQPVSLYSNCDLFEWL
jgi:hypothetical protein